MLILRLAKASSGLKCYFDAFRQPEKNTLLNSGIIHYEFSPELLEKSFKNQNENPSNQDKNLEDF
ncbi:hypothetical protein L5B97_00540 [Avibacterium sp. 20-15]|uniref:hypothetical protein n=1 Tax=unclassified Avibacterium TaxID=2685287 RepID=UPI002026B245|nr:MULTISPECIES: hypothetical protein [unclassified Avibacterium]MCW9731988.1 hypothetical protein [Avibacterium sp. 20-15]URL04171.1 hypothetical protein L4F93_11620 [Avibacterium sp. 20-132]